MRLVQPISRRAWLAGAAAILGGWPRTVSTSAAEIQTVTGPIDAAALGVTLMHEHLLVDFIGAAGVSRTRYNADDVFNVALPHLRKVRELGCETLVDCTPAYLGRDPELLRRLSVASGLRILTNTGLYGAANDKHLPGFSFTESAEQLAARWIDEATTGIERTTIKPAFMKIGVDGAPLSEVDAKLARAAALTTRQTGLPIASHTGSGAAALAQLDILQAIGVPLSSFIWVHAQSEKDDELRIRAATRGAWIELDGIAPGTLQRHLDLVVKMKKADLLNHVLVSHDAGWYHVGESGGGTFRAFDTLFTEFIPALRRAGISETDIRGLVVENPRRALTPAAGRWSV
jgi:phosphotriesterase-related protein